MAMTTPGFAARLYAALARMLERKQPEPESDRPETEAERAARWEKIVWPATRARIVQNSETCR